MSIKYGTEILAIRSHTVNVLFFILIRYYAEQMVIEKIKGKICSAY